MGKMKMTVEHYQMIEEAMEELDRSELVKKEYKDKGHSKQRFVWDVFRAMRIHQKDGTVIGGIDFACNTLYGYLHDDHIQTALFKIIDY